MFLKCVQSYWSTSSLRPRRIEQSLLLLRLVWCAVCIVCISVAIVMMKIVWLRYKGSPTVTSVDTTNYPVWNIPFPAVTLCDNNKVYRPAAMKLAANL